MQDEETGSWWQQVSGEAIFGPLKGHQLKAVPFDELSFALWKKEQPQGRVLQPDQSVPKDEYIADWEKQVTKLPIVTKVDNKISLSPRTIIIGIEINGIAKAYPLETIQQQSPLLDSIAGVPIIILLGEDQQSVRVFNRTVNGKAIELFVNTKDAAKKLFDADSGSEWDFTGRSISGPQKGYQLTTVPMLKDYWFDWINYNPNTAIYRVNGTKISIE